MDVHVGWEQTKDHKNMRRRICIYIYRNENQAIKKVMQKSKDPKGDHQTTN